MTLDSSVLVEYLLGSELGEKLRSYFEELTPEEHAYCSLHAVAETYYVLCRVRGAAFAREKLQEPLSSNIVRVEVSREVASKTGEIKCARAISLPDSSCIGTAILTECQAVSTAAEKDLQKEMKRDPFDVDVVFLGDPGA